MAIISFLRKINFDWKFKHTLFLIFAIFFIYSFHNALYFPAKYSFDGYDHYQYAKNLTIHWRLPTPDESAHFINPPLWYLFGGLTIMILENVFIPSSWEQTIRIWQMINPILTILSVIYWFKIYEFLYPKETNRWLFFALFLFSLPIIQKMAAMLSVEPLLMFLASLTLYFLVTKFLIHYDTASIFIIGVILGLATLSKITIATLVITIFIILLCLRIINKISSGILLRSVIIFLIPIFLLSGWINAWQQYTYGFLNTGGKNYKPSKQKSSFYFYIPIRLMFSYPMRQYLGQTYLPIMYSDFWGDYWNYYSQRRFSGINLDYIRNIDRLKTTPERIKVLIYQNIVNIPATILMLIAVFWASFISIKAFFKKTYTIRNIFYLTILIFFILSWISYTWVLSRSPKWTGSNVKPYHLLFIWPVSVFLATELIFEMTKNKLLLRKIITSLFILTFLSNLVFSWF